MKKTPRVDLRCFFAHRRRSQSRYSALRVTAFARIKSLQNDFFPCRVGKRFIFFQHVPYAGTAGTMELFRVRVQYIFVFYRLCWQGGGIFSRCIRGSRGKRVCGGRCGSRGGRFCRPFRWFWRRCFRWNRNGICGLACPICNFKADCSANGSFTVWA